MNITNREYNYPVSKLLDTIKKNREAHTKLFKAVRAAYRAEAIRYLGQSLDLAKEGKEIRRGVDLIEPVDHTGDYDQIIEMLKMTSDTIISLDSREFSMFVMDKWGWKGQFEAMAISYGLGAE